MKAGSLLIFLLFLVSAGSNVAAVEISDMGAAEEWCDAAMLDRLEGIWEYPDDHTTVLIRKSKLDSSVYDIIAVASPDTRLKAGEKIGYMKISPSPDKFEMGVYRNRNSKGLLSEIGKCYAQLNEKNDALLVKGRSVKFSLGSTRWILPSFWRMIRVSVKDPLESLPKGLIRIYPKSKRRQPDYL